MQVMRLLVSQQINHKTASLLLYALQTASTNLRMTSFQPHDNDVILDPRDVANTPLNCHVWEDEDFEEEEEEETDADRAIAALETVRKKKEEEAKWMKWAEARYPDPRKTANPTATVTAAGSAVVAPAAPPKKPAASLDPKEIRAEIADMVRKQLLPAVTAKFAPGKEPDKRPGKKAT
jgi:hypothetical protein